MLNSSANSCGLTLNRQIWVQSIFSSTIWKDSEYSYSLNVGWCVNNSAYVWCEEELDSLYRAFESQSSDKENGED